MLSASSIDRIATCPDSETLQHNREISDLSEGGHGGHGFLADVATYGRDQALAKAPDDVRHVYASIDIEALGVAPGAFAAEVAFVYDWRLDTAVEVGRDIGRDYIKHLGRDFLPSENPGTADAIALRTPTWGVLVDFKTGWLDVAPAKRNRQLRFLALAFARAHGLDMVTVAIVYVRGSGNPKFDAHTFDGMDLELIADEIRSIAEGRAAAKKRAAEGKPGRFTVSKYCRYCPAMRHCPAQTGMIRSAASGEATARYEIAPETPPEQVAVAYQFAEAAILAAKKLKESCLAYARTTPVPMPDGKVLREVSVKGRPKVEPSGARKYLHENYGPDVATGAMVLSTTFSAIQKALRPWVARTPKAKISVVAKEVRKELTLRGHVQQGSSRKVRLVEDDEVREGRLEISDEALELESKDDDEE